MTSCSGATLVTADLIDRGFTADVYAWGRGRLLKLFRAGTAVHEVRREYDATRAVSRAGLPAPAVFDLVEVDGRVGIVMERIDGPSMFARVQARPWTIVTAATELAELHVRIHRWPCPPELPSLRERLGEAISNAAGLSHERKESARAWLAEMPDGLAVCHGDFHPANVVHSSRGPVIIDWGQAARGDALGDVAYTSLLMRRAHLPAWSPRYMHALLKCSRSTLHRSYLRRCLQLHGGTSCQVKAWEPVLDAAGRWRAGGGDPAAA